MIITTVLVLSVQIKLAVVVVVVVVVCSACGFRLLRIPIARELGESGERENTRYQRIL